MFIIGSIFYLIALSILEHDVRAPRFGELKANRLIRVTAFSNYSGVAMHKATTMMV